MSSRVYEAEGQVPCRPYRLGVGVDGVGGVFIAVVMPWWWVHH